MLIAFFGSVASAITEMFTCVGQALSSGVNLIYDPTLNSNAGGLTGFGILVSIPVAAGLVWVAYHVLKRCITIRG